MIEVKKQSQLQFHGIDIVNIGFNSEKPISSSNEQFDVKLDIQPKVFIPKNDISNFKIIMFLTISVEGYFNLDILAAGHFEIKDVETDIRKQFINVNAPAIMFPYVRSFVSTLTSNMGNIIHSINIPTQFFSGELEEIIDDVE